MGQVDADTDSGSLEQEKKISILAVDDERVNLILLKGFLQGLDVDVVMATSGHEALEIARTRDVALVLLDVMMPGMSGFNVAEHLRAGETTRHVPIIFITAISKEQRHIFHGYELGAVDYLFKPLDPEILVGKVGVFIELHRQKMALAQTAAQLEHTVSRLERSEKALRYQAFHDALTGLANRNLLMDRMNHALELGKRRGDGHLAVIFVDMDRFKVINDTMGHVFGDQVLVETARRLSQCVRSMDTVARYGGDEFVVLLEELPSRDDALEVARRMRASLNRPYILEGRTVSLSASFGVVPLDVSGAGAEDVLRNGTLAMHEARKQGPNRIMAFNPDMHKQAVFLMTLENDLRLALDRKEFHLAFQPIVHMGAPTMLGFEVLLRWKHPERGMVPPGVFIPVAEESGLIDQVGRWVLETTLKTASRWRGNGLAVMSNLVFSVNISGRQFARQDLVGWIERSLEDNGLPADCLKLEITETSIMANAAEAVGKLGRLKDLGVKLSVDDFGTGYSSLSYLQRFPLDTLKIDLSFVQKLETNPGNREIVRAIVGLAHTLGLKVVAEGVETQGQEDILLGMGCDYGQGYRYAKPMPEQAALEFASGYRGLEAE